MAIPCSEMRINFEGIKALIKDNLEEGKDKKVILAKLEKHFSLTEKEAEAYFDMYNNIR